MTGLSLARIVVDELAVIGPLPAQTRKASGTVRRTIWSPRWPGFGLRIYASGRRTWVVQAYMGGRTRTVIIGDARVITKAQASDVARRVLLRAQVGDNPAKDRVIARNAPRYEVFLQEYWSKMLLRWKPSTRERNIIYRKRHLDRAFAGRFINQISEADVLRWFSRITNNSGPAAANRVLEILRAMFNRAEAWGVLPEGSNPCNGIRNNKLRKHECWLSDEELARFGAILDRIKQDDPMSVAAIQLIMLTGCRKGEILNLRWSEVKGRRLLLHDAKTGPRTVWLGEPAVRLLASLPRHDTLEQIFRRDDKPLSVNMMEHHYRRARTEAGLKHVRLHDLRHSFASHAAMQSETLPMIGKLLGHTRIQSTARYAHLDDRTVLAASEQVARTLEIFLV
jgi:integrase